MKILTATTKPYSRTVYITELDAEEINSLLILSSYSKIPVVRDGKNEMVDRDQMIAGDVVEKISLTNASENTLRFLDSREEITKSMQSLKGAMTKLQNTLPV